MLSHGVYEPDESSRGIYAPDEYSFDEILKNYVSTPDEKKALIGGIGVDAKTSLSSLGMIRHFASLLSVMLQNYLFGAQKKVLI